MDRFTCIVESEFICDKLVEQTSLTGGCNGCTGCIYEWIGFNEFNGICRAKVNQFTVIFTKKQCQIQTLRFCSPTKTLSWNQHCLLNWSKSSDPLRCTLTTGASCPLHSGQTPKVQTVLTPSNRHDGFMSAGEQSPLALFFFVRCFFGNCVWVDGKPRET